MSEILCHARDPKTGAIIDTSRPHRMTEEDVFRNHWREWGLAEDAINHKWDEFLQVEAFKDRMERERLPCGAPHPKAAIEKAAREYESTIIKNRKWGR